MNISGWSAANRDSASSTATSSSSVPRPTSAASANHSTRASPADFALATTLRCDPEVWSGNRWHPPHELDAVHRRHVEVEQYEIGSELATTIDRSTRIGQPDDMCHTSRPQVPAQQNDIGFYVVDDQDTSISEDALVTTPAQPDKSAFERRILRGQRHHIRRKRSSSRGRRSNKE